MDRGLAVVLTAVAGGLIAAQAPINGKLGGVIGKAPAATVNFLVGLVLLLVLLAVTGQMRDLANAPGSGLPWWCFIGGLLGAAYVATALSTVGTLGAGGVTAATIAGQLTASLVIDQVGLLGVARNPVTAGRLAGVVLLSIGAYLIVRE